MAHTVNKNSIAVAARTALRIEHGLVSFVIKNGVVELTGVRDGAGNDMKLSFDTNATIQVACERGVTIDGKDSGASAHVVSW